MKFLYFDTPLIRSLSDRPEVWDQLYDPFIRIFGHEFKPIESFYLFFEYIGFTKKRLEVPQIFKKPHLSESEKLAKIDPHLRIVKEEDIDILDKSLNDLLREMTVYSEEKLFFLQKTIIELIEERKRRISSSPFPQMLVNSLFGNIFFLAETDFFEFVKYASRYLSWDIFCSIQPSGLSLNPMTCSP